jgi:hypothetical protein
MGHSDSSQASEAGMQALLDGFFAAHHVNLDAEPTPDALRAMQRLLDGVPERWRDAEVAWWPTSPSEMWAAPESWPLAEATTAGRGF